MLSSEKPERKIATTKWINTKQMENGRFIFKYINNFIKDKHI